VREWLIGMEVDPATREDVLLASGEALANAVEHAYIGREAGTAQVELSLAADRTLHLRVRDAGVWRTPSEDPGLRGRGFFLMRNLMDRVDIHHDASGTEVRMSLRPRAAAPAPARTGPAGPASAAVAFAGDPDGALVGVVTGDIDASRLTDLLDQIDRAVDRGRDLTLDLDGVGYIDSSGARLLVAVAERLSACGATLRLRVASGSPAGRLIALCGLDLAPGVAVDDP
jgi:anti-anti-sigma factor